MPRLAENSTFVVDYEKLRNVSLNPDRHAAANAYEHCEMVRMRAKALAELNNCSDGETALLEDLACVHDIGKIQGTAKPQASVKLLSRYSITNEQFSALVKYHDTNLPWYQAAKRGQPVSDKAWNKLVSKLDLRLLCLFMVADRVDCPGGWRANPPLIWFLEQVKNRGLLDTALILDDGPEVVSACSWK